MNEKGNRDLQATEGVFIIFELDRPYWYTIHAVDNPIVEELLESLLNIE